MSLTDDIYRELIGGLENGLDWQQFLAKYGASKGPLYNALGRVLTEIPAKVTALNEKRKRTQQDLDQAGLRLNQLNQKISEADKNIQAKNQEVAMLEEKENTLKKQIEVLKGDLEQKSKLSEQLQGLEKSGFGEERLKTLRITLVEIGTKRGLKRNEAVNAFFAELNDYDAIQGFTQELQRLENIIRTKTLEAEKWQAEADSLSRRHKDLNEAIAAVQGLMKHGVRVEQITSWNGIVSNLGGPEELQGKLGQYKSVSELLNARHKEVKACEQKVKELNAQIATLEERKAEIESSIKSLSSSGLKEITKVSDKAIAGLKSLASSSVESFTRVSNKAMAGEKSLLEEIKVETKSLSELKAEAGKLEKELMYARYLTTGDQAVLKAFPKEVVIAFLDRALTYCKLNELNPMVRVPDGFSRKYSSIWPATEVSLVDLINWTEAGLAGALQ